MTDSQFFRLNYSFSAASRRKISSFSFLNMHNRMSPFRDLLTQIFQGAWSYNILDVLFLVPAVILETGKIWKMPLFYCLITNFIFILIFSIGSVDAGPLPWERAIYTIRFFGFYPFLILIGMLVARDDRWMTKFFESIFWTSTFATVLGVGQFVLFQLFGYEIMQTIYTREKLLELTQGGRVFEYDWATFRISSIFNFVTIYAGFSFLYFVFCVSAFMRTKKSQYKYGGALALVALITSGSRGSVLIAVICLFVYLNMLRRLIWALPVVVLFVVVIAPLLVSSVFELSEVYSSFVVDTILQAIAQSEYISFKAGMDATFMYATFQSLGIESWIGKLFVEFGYLYAMIVVAVIVPVAGYTFFVLAWSFWYRTEINIMRSSLAAYVVVNLVYSTKGTDLELYPRAPYLFILLGILVGTRRLVTVAQVWRRSFGTLRLTSPATPAQRPRLD